MKNSSRGERTTNQILSVLPEYNQIKYQSKKPEIYCIYCNRRIEPGGFCSKGWPVNQYLICPACDKKEEKKNSEILLKNLQKYRRKRIREIALRRGAPPDKTYKVNIKDFPEIIISVKGQKSNVTFDRLFNMFIENKSVLIIGGSGSGKSHLATMLFMMSIYHFAQDAEEYFQWISLKDLHREISTNYFNEKYILQKVYRKRVLSFVFGDFSDDVKGSIAKETRLKDLLFSVFDNRYERMKTYNQYNIWMTTLTELQLQDIGWEFYRRLIEMSFIIDLGKNKGFSEETFKERPKVLIH